MNVGIDPDAGAARRYVSGDSAGAWSKISLRVFGVYPALDRYAVVLDAPLAHLDPLAGGDFQL